MDISQLSPILQVGSSLLAFIVALSVVVTVHEFGHYIVGRWCGIHADVFSIGFGPAIAWRTDRRGTRWQIAALPLGGYVKFCEDEARSKIERNLGRGTMRAAPIWAKALTVAAGPAFNMALALVLLAGLAMTKGEIKPPFLVVQINACPVHTDLIPGDKILSIDGIAADVLFADKSLLRELPASEAHTYVVDRAGVELPLVGGHPYPALLDSVSDGSPASRAGLRPGDVITALSGTEIARFMDLSPAINLSSGQPLVATVWRSGKFFDAKLEPTQISPERYSIGVQARSSIDIQRSIPGPVEALALGAADISYIGRSMLSSLYGVISGSISSCNLSGPIGIAEQSMRAASKGSTTYITFVAIISVSIAIFNLFPIPVLDGGHLVFFAYEAVAGREPRPQMMRVLSIAGLILILVLMVFTLRNDLICPI